MEWRVKICFEIQISAPLRPSGLYREGSEINRTITLYGVSQQHEAGGLVVTVPHNAARAWLSESKSETPLSIQCVVADGCSLHENVVAVMHCLDLV